MADDTEGFEIYQQDSRASEPERPKDYVGEFFSPLSWINRRQQQQTKLVESKDCQLYSSLGSSNLTALKNIFYGDHNLNYAERAMGVTGTPGIGKTMFLPYLLSFLAASRKTVVLTTLERAQKFMFSRWYPLRLSVSPCNRETHLRSKDSAVTQSRYSVTSFIRTLFEEYLDVNLDSLE